MGNSLADLVLNEGEKAADETAKCSECKETDARIEQLQAKGAQVHLDVDATKLKQRFPNQTFKRIHWNGPHDGSKFQEQTLPDLMLKFFRSCATVQNTGGRVHLSIPQPPKNEKGLSGWDFYQGYVYHLVRASAASGYIVIKKRKFPPERYPGYVHQQTKHSKAANVFEKAKEFVFEKIDTVKFQEMFNKSKDNEGKINVTKLAQSLLDLSPKKGKCTIGVGKFYDKGRSFYACTSDDDSSGYTESGGE